LSNMMWNNVTWISRLTVCILTVLNTYTKECFAQSKSDPVSFPKGYFRPPLDLPPQASGSFGELRANHFHSGTDYRTNQRTGYPVYATADGFVSRLRVQIGGGGHIVYLDHPNGY